ncbi:MAG: tetratricopeptide repeat protein [Pyrinomonadaceae bacterium]
MSIRKVLLTAFLTTAILFGNMPATAQDIVPVGDITGGSSIFVFRRSARAVPQKYLARSKPKRTVVQRKETARKIRRQYVALAKKAPRRERVAAVDPKNLPPEIRLRVMPKNEASRLFAGVGEYYIDRDDSSNAIDFFREANSLDSKNLVARKGLSEALALRGNEVLAKGDAKAARESFHESLKFNPNNAVAYFGLGELYGDEDNDAESLANYEKALSFDTELTEIYVPLGILYYQAGRIADADNLLSKAVITDPESAETQYFVGLIRFSQGKNEQALASFRMAKAKDPNYAEAYFYSGETLVRENKNSAAVAEYQKAVELKPDYFEAWFGLGNAYFELEKYPEAIAAYERAVRLKNNNIEAQTNLGDAYRMARDYNRSEASYNIAAALFERDPNYNNTDKADTYGKIGFVIAKQCEINMRKAVNCRWNTATRSLEKAVALTGSNVDQSNLGWAYFNAARNDTYSKANDQAKIKLEKALVNLEAAVKSNPTFLEGPLMNLGMTYSDLGRYPEAIGVIKRVVDKRPDWAFASNELGLAHSRNNNNNEAIKYFRRAVEKDNKFADAYFNLGMMEFRAGNVVEAKKAHVRLKQLGRNDLAARLAFATGGAVLR